MTSIKEFIKQHKNVLLIAVVIVAIAFAWKFINSFSEIVTDSAWDGVVARSFASGTGTEANPYVISNASEYGYFKQVLEGEDASVYVDKNYVISNGFNYGEYELNINNTIPFSGSIDGHGSLIYNAKIVNSLFNTIDEAVIKNISFDDIDYTLNSDTGALLANEMHNTSVDMLVINGEVTFSEEGSHSFGGLVYTSEGNEYTNIIINSNIINDDVDAYKFVYGSVDDVGNNILINKDNYKNSKVDIDIDINNFEIVDDNISLIDIADISNYVNDIYKITLINNKFVIEEIEATSSEDNPDENEKNPAGKVPTKRNAVATDTITEHASGADGNTFYINDLVADKNYLKGLNFAEIRSTSIPSGVSTGYYDDDYLVKVEIIYDGADINNSSLVGALSPLNNENTNKFVYFKYYPLERNSNGTLATNSDGDNYIRIELIDNPFTKRPYANNIEYGFNGWVCNQNSDTTSNLCENAVFSFKKDDYTRYMDIPVDGGSELIIHLNASWYRADVRTARNNITNFKSMSMQSPSYTTTSTVHHSGYAFWRQNYATMVATQNYSFYDSMPAGIWYKTSQNGTTYTYVSSASRCYSYTCYGYTANTNGIVADTQYTGGSFTFVPSFNATDDNTTTTINNFNGTYMYVVDDPNGNYSYDEPVTHYHLYLPAGANMEGFYYKVSNPTSAMIDTGEYYTNDGSPCTNASSCTTAYKLIQYNDSLTNSNGHSIYLAEEDNGDIVDADKYYYLVTRDMNIFRYVYTGTNGNNNNTNGLAVSYLNVNRPFTVTGTAVNETSANGILDLSNNLTVANDLVIENIRVRGPNSAGNNNTTLGNDDSSSYSIYANSKNLKIGRNVVSSRNNTYLVGYAIMGGTNSTGPSGTFRVIVESGFYYAYHSGAMSGNSNFTMNETTILGNDYDRISNVNNKFKLLIGIDGYAGGHHTAGSDSLFASYNIVKSGMLGFNSNESANTDNTAGMYIGGRASKCVNSLTGAKVEGGIVNTIVGGYGYNGTATTNSTYIGMSGGTVRAIYGGAGHSTTVGNRIINVTGGLVNYSVLGGSDSYSSTATDDGVVQGSTLVYVGGTVTVGDGSTNELNGVEAGSVFGAGGGNSNPNATSKGTVYNSHVIINGGTINTSVYGGGNFGSTGTQYSAVSNTTIDIYAGNIGAVYGGSKSAGFSQSNYAGSSLIDINVSGGIIGNIYGGSNTKGTVYGSVDMDITGGTITGNVYGGGQGNETIISNDVDVTIGTTPPGPTINGSVYGGSAFGTVNSANAGEVNVTVNSGTITGSVFGGGQGSATYTPYVNGDITVTVNGGNIGNVFGGNDQAGTHTENNEVYLNGGTIGNVYGGGNLSSVTNTHVYLDGATVNNLYGGSNTSGNVSTTTVVMTSGTAGNIYGGNNAGGTDGSTSVEVKDGTVTGNIYGGGKGNATVVTGDVDVIIGDSNGGPNITGSVYGGSAFGTVNSANAGEVSVTVNDGVITGSVFGGGQGSTTYTPYVNGDITVTINGGDITSVFGGNDQAGTHTKVNEVYLNGGIIGSVYGGGNKSSVTNTNVYLDGATVTNIYGGSNTLGDVSTTNVDITSGTVQNIYGGNNEGGTCGTTDINVTGTATINGSIYGGGNEVNTTTTTVTLNSATGTVPNVYGGGNSASVTTSNVTNNGVTVTNIFGGSNSSGTVTTANITQNSGTVTNIYGGNNAGGNTVTSNIDINNGTITTIYGGGNQANGGTSNVNVDGGNITSIFGGGNSAGLTTSNVTINGGTIGDMYGGSNNSGTVTTANIEVNAGTITNIYGGGNRAAVGTPTVVVDAGTITNIYGGGNLAQVTGDTTVDINGGTISGNVYGGGNFGVVAGDSVVTITDATILGNAYAGGNGASATLQGSTNITIDGNTVIGTASSVAPNSGCVFGGGNQALTGTQANNDSTSSVNIVGGTIYGNVYGGAKFSVIYGNTIVNIGQTAYTSNNLTKTDIYIKGNVFGGGEANSSGSEIYDWSFISVTEGVNITIDADTYTNFQIDGSFYGGGNASTADGDSYLLIRNYGSGMNPKRNVSIQRVTYVTVDNSSILLAGAIDRANDYDRELFSISRVDDFKLQNNSCLFLVTGANLLKNFQSLDSNGNPAVVTIQNDHTVTTKSVDNRVYMYEGKNLNIAEDQQVTIYGEVTGMSFLGIFNFANGDVNTGIYDSQYDSGDILDWSGLFAKGSYVLGKHLTNHNIKINGFYSNFMNEETQENEVDYIDPTPKNAQFYMWYIGENIIEYNVNLVASKYSTLGSIEQAFLEFSRPNTSFEIESFDISDIATGVSLVDKNNIPRIAATTSDANNIFGLAMEASNSGWLTTGKTSFYTSSPWMSGVTYYEGENSTVVPTMLFYLYHSKNITEEKNLGTVRITIKAITKINALSNEVERLVVNVNMSTALFQTTEYEGAMAPGDKYELFTSTATNITTKSKFSAYYGLYATGTNIYRAGYHRALTSSYVLPENTKITMIDFSTGTTEYYYHVITATDVTNATAEYQIENECSYNLSLFTRMGSISNNSNYDDATKNVAYYNNGDSSEEFIFIVDFSDTNITQDELGNQLLIEIRDSNDEAIVTVLGIQHAQLTYNLYAGRDSTIDETVVATTNPLYIGYNDTFEVSINYQNSALSGVTITDTQYFDSKLGVQISIKDANNNLVSGTDLTGAYFLIDGTRYYPDIAGYTHIKLANKVGNTKKWIIFNTENASLATGSYTFTFEAFGSVDGIYYSTGSSDFANVPINIINSKYGLNPVLNDNSVIFSANNDKALSFTINYTSLLSNPNIRLAMYRREYDQVYDTDYQLVDLQDYTDTTLTTSSNTNEYILTSSPAAVNTQSIMLKDELLTGTYRLSFRLYDSNTMIGEINRYIVIK